MHQHNGASTSRVMNLLYKKYPLLVTGRDSTDEIRSAVAILMSMIGILSAISFGMYRFYINEMPMGFLDLAVALFLSLNLLLSNKKNMARLWQYYSVYILSAYFLFIFLQAQYSLGASLWVLTIPLLSCYIVGLRRGIWITALSFLFIIAAFQWLDIGDSGPSFKVRFCLVYLLDTIMAYAFGTVQARIVSSLKDEIDHRSAMQQEISKEKELIENLYKIVRCAVVSVNTEGVVESFNAEAEKLTGYLADEAVGQPVSLWTDDSCDQRYAALHDGSASEFREKECVIICKNGEKRYIIKNGVPVFDGDGKVIGAIESFIDITDRKITEKELIEARNTAQKESIKAQEASRAKSVFLTMMTHEIRTPLNGIIGMNNLMLETSLTNEQREYVEGTKHSAEMLLALVNDILDFSRIESGNVKIDSIDFDLRTTVEEAMDAVACKAIEKDLDIHTLLHASVPEMVRGDPTRIRQLIASIAGNAVKFTESGEVLLTVKVDAETEDMVKTRFEITDTGIGITSDQMKMLFKPFSQVDSRLSRKFGGTGLGLALSKKVVQLLGGQIGLSSLSGKGSTFWFSLELKKSAARKKTAGITANIAGMNVLIADPSSAGREVMVHYLEHAGCGCQAFSSPEKVLDALGTGKVKDEHFDAMILTMQQVGVAGQQLIRKIKIDAMLKSIPLVLVTAIGKRGDAHMMKEAGVAAYLTRPVRQRQLLECLGLIRENIGKKKGSEVDRSRHEELITRHTIAEVETEKKFRILVAEDNAVNRKVVKKFLDKAGYGCDFAENGVDAVEAFRKKQYGMIIMDCLMPVMSGYDATRAIREEEKNSVSDFHIPVCALTASTDKGERVRCFDAGMDDYLSKPLNYADFVIKIKYWEENTRVQTDSFNRQENRPQ